MKRRQFPLEICKIDLFYDDLWDEAYDEWKKTNR